MLALSPLPVELVEKAERAVQLGYNCVLHGLLYVRPYKRLGDLLAAPDQLFRDPVYFTRWTHPYVSRTFMKAVIRQLMELNNSLRSVRGEALPEPRSSRCKGISQEVLSYQPENSCADR